MSITVIARPAQLSWANYTPLPTVIDPADGTLEDAYTSFNFNIPDRAPRTIGGQIALAETFAIVLTPLAQVRTGAAQTADLLSHEQLHYDVGIVTARALARQLEGLRAPDRASLGAALSAAAQLHFQRRAGLIQRRYDLETQHGTVPHFQRIWKNQMTACLANPNSTHLAGYWL